MSSADTESDIEEDQDDIDYTYASAEESTESESNFDGNPEESSNNEIRYAYLSECTHVIHCHEMDMFKNGESVVRRCHRFYGNGLPLTFWLETKSEWQTISIEPIKWICYKRNHNPIHRNLMQM